MQSTCGTNSTEGETKASRSSTARFFIWRVSLRSNQSATRRIASLAGLNRALEVAAAVSSFLATVRRNRWALGGDHDTHGCGMTKVAMHLPLRCFGKGRSLP